MEDEILHTLSDGSRVLRVPVGRLLAIPVWQGNRVINFDHVAAIAAKVGDNVRSLDFGYRTIRTIEHDAGGKEIVVRQLVDGQHRQRVIAEHFATDILGETNRDFKVIVIEKTVMSELEIIEYFNTINAVNPIQWSDKNLIINAYIAELEAVFNTSKTPNIRKTATRRPFLCVDKLRQALKAEEARLQSSVEAIRSFVGRVREWNTKQLVTADIQLLGIKDASEQIMLQKAIEKRFMLGFDRKLRWIQELL
jgi:hypothetical protein